MSNLTGKTPKYTGTKLRCAWCGGLATGMAQKGFGIAKPSCGCNGQLYVAFPAVALPTGVATRAVRRGN